MDILSKMLGVPTIGKAITKVLKTRGFKPLQIPLDKTLERQERILHRKFRVMEGTEIGKKLGVRSRIQLRDLPLTDYSFYRDYFNNPAPDAFMFPLEDYIRVKTSGTSGTEKWYLIPRKAFSQGFRETGVLLLLSLFHDEDKITLEYGDVFYLNIATGSYLGGAMLREEKTGGIVNFVPNFNLSYEEKVQYFINNYQSIDAANMLASTLVSQIMPAIDAPISLKALGVGDSAVAEKYMKEIKEFAGVFPKAIYGSTETLHPSIYSVQYPLGFIFDWRRGFFEFIPKGGKADKNETVGFEDIKVGEVYELIYTSFLGEITRYKTGDSFLCVSKSDDILEIDFPVFKFHARLDKTISLHNFTRISEDELLMIFEELSISYTNFTTRVDIDKGLQYLTIFIDCKEGEVAKEIEDRIHNKLVEIDRDYRDLTDFFKYNPIRVETVSTEVFMEYLIAKTGYPKVQRIGMEESEFRRLREIQEKHHRDCSE